MEESISHTRWDCTYHIVWIAKYRKKTLYGEVRRELSEIIKDLLRYRKIEMVEGAVCVDHIHMSVRIPPKESVSKVMGYVKGKSALALFDRHQEWRRRFGRDRTLWARGYYVSTVGLNEGAVRKYIREQENADRMTDS